LFVGGTQVVEQIEDLIHYPVRTSTRTVDLVDDHDRLQTLGECLLGHETGLRHRAVNGVNQQQHGVNHGQYALYLTTEVGVTRGINTMLMR
jgi:nitrate reductase alpha subunit